MRLTCLLLISLFASPLAAQEVPRLEVGVDLSHWRSEERVGDDLQLSGTLRAAVLISSSLPASLGFSATYAPDAETAPGLLSFDTEFAQRLRRVAPGEANVFIGAGAGIIRFSTERAREEIEECNRQPGCMYEGPPAGSGWRPMLSGSFGADVPLGRGAMLQPALQLVLPVGEQLGQPDGTIYRLGVGLAWRP